MTDKPIRWIGSSLKDLTNFPDAVRKKAGFQLQQIPIKRATSLVI